MAPPPHASAFVLGRDRVLERISRRAAPFLVLLAPAGYGKTHVARSIAQTYERSLYLQCELHVDFKAAIAELLGAAGTEPADIALAWSTHGSSALIIDNIECLKSDAADLTVLREFLQAPAARSSVLFCGRRDPGVEFAAHADPHNITFLRSEQLAFDQIEMRELFGAAGVDDALRYRLHLFTGGWPAAALYCARSARAGNVDELLDAPEVAFADFLDYIDANVISYLPEHVLSALCAVASIPGIGALDLTRLYGLKNHFDLVGEMTRVHDIASVRDSAAFSLNPLLRLAIRTKRPLRVVEAQRSFGELCSERKDFGHAAQVYLASGDAAKAEECLKRGRELGATFFDSFSPLPQAWPGVDLVSRPELWAAVLGARRLSQHPMVLANEAVTVLDAFDEKTDPMVVMRVRLLSAVAFIDAGMIEEAAALVDSQKVPDGNPDVRTVLPVLVARAMLDSYLGKHERAVVAWHQIRPYALDNPSVFAQLTRIEIRAARDHGQWEVEHDQLRRMLHAAEQSRAVTIIAMALAEGVFGSWLVHETETFEDYVAQLTSLMGEHELPSLVNFHLATLGLQPTLKNFSKYWDAAAFLMACASESNAVRASELAEVARNLSDGSGATFLRILTRVAIAVKTPARGEEVLQEALVLAASDSPALAQSLTRVYAEGPPFGMLAPLLNRLRAPAPVRKTEAELDLRIGLGDVVVRRAGISVSISEGGWGLLLSLAVQRRPVHRDVLCDRLWPAMSLEAGYNALKMCVRRTRLQLNAPDAIISTQGGYALADFVQVDLSEMEQLEAAITAGALKGDDVSRVKEHFDCMRHGRPANFATWEWFAATEQRLESISRHFGEFLARRAIEATDYRAAVEIAEYLVSLDPLDETARKLTIMAHVASNDAATALREFRQYAKILKDELDAEPSADLVALLK